MTPEQEAKLPRYAQSALRVLRMDLKRAEERLQRIDAGESDTWVEAMDIVGRRHRYEGLVPSSTIHFGPNPEVSRMRRQGVRALWVPAEKRGRPDVDFEVPGHLDVWADNQVAVRPLSGNRIAVYPVEYSSGLVG